jgi:hypothetical protein
VKVSRPGTAGVPGCRFRNYSVLFFECRISSFYVDTFAKSIRTTSLKFHTLREGEFYGQPTQVRSHHRFDAGATALSVRVIAQGTLTMGDWGSLRSLATDSKLVVKLKTGKTVEGKLTSVSDSSLTVKSKNTPVEIKKEDIASVYNVTNKSATTATLIEWVLARERGGLLGGTRRRY